LIASASLVGASRAIGHAGTTHAKRWGGPAQPNFPKPKYYSESDFSIHYDERYAVEQLSEKEQRDALVVLIHTYLATFRELGIPTWLMHGTLLGWWWGKKVMPWDYDVDVQIMETDMYFLAAYYNMTSYYFEYDKIPEGRTFVLDVNPYFTHRGIDDWLNLIDARWVDTHTGLYIDITAARYAKDYEEGDGILYEKNGHQYRDTYLFPLLDTTFEGVPVKIPFKYKDMLISEYKEKVLTTTEYHQHKFDDEKMEWIPIEPS
jgi:phosphorylcholine metabolism protein LicD